MSVNDGQTLAYVSLCEFRSLATFRSLYARVRLHHKSYINYKYIKRKEGGFSSVIKLPRYDGKKRCRHK